ncbi:aldolase/citrate lyase family protein [Erythrobacter sp. Alg231-14]|uniref:aldolase/citrate lyase family protein n=1 Tax=Erythrobacter sp. Alg231-14 TaxID=1922225 RepID=UPI000D5591B7
MTTPTPTQMCTVLITDSPDLAASAEQSGVGRIMVDLERNGKFERQKLRDTWISKHRVEDIAPVARAVSSADVMVRINPSFKGSAQEIDRAIDAGANCIMLPMFRTLKEIDRIGAMIAGRCRFVPLVETGDAMAILESVARRDAVDEVFIGLNDLHISLGLDFMFQPLADGLLDDACAVLRAIGKPFGFGGIARIGEGDLPAEFIVKEHARLGSTRVNLSRTFARDGLDGGGVLEREVRALIALYDAAAAGSPDDLRRNHQEVQTRIQSILTRIRSNQRAAS